MTLAYGQVTTKIVVALSKFGPMTAIEIATKAGLDRNSITAVLSRMCKHNPKTPKRLHISDWTREVPGHRNILRAVYDLGDAPDKKRPKPLTSLESTRNYRARQRTKTRINSVFNIGAIRL